MRIQAEAVAGPRVDAEDATQRLRVIRVDRKTLLARANAAQRRRRREERDSRRLGNRRRSSWLFGGAKRPHDDAVEPPSPFASNVVVSAKYSLWNFAPRVLLAQLQRPSNVYFLFIAVLQTIREVSNTSGIPTILLPLAVVFVCSAIKEALEDRERHRADRVANSRPVLALTPLGSWEQRQWGDLRVGDIVKVMNDQTIPADLFLLSAEAVEHDDDAEFNLAYIETKSLDGETNLKIRTAIPLVAALCRESNSKSRATDGGEHNELRGMMVCEQPNNRVTSFEGTFSVVLSPAQAQTLGTASLMQTEMTGDGLVRVRVPVTAKQMMLRSCVLRNTRSVTGMVIFTGHETKVFCSNTEPVVKTSSVERRLNRLIIGIVFIQQLVCFLGALLGAHWMHTEGDSFWYLLSASERRHHTLTGVSTSHPLAELAKLHLRYFIIMQNFVPISLNVSLEFVKYWQAYFIEQDLEMYDKLSDTPAMVRSSALNEDLGRVHHVFTDKTGTLTMNLMLFRYCTVGGKHYGGPMQDKDMEAEIPSDNSSSTAAEPKDGPRFVDFDPTELFADICAGGEQAETLRRFLRHLALCHTLIPTKSLAEMCSTSFPEYSASSPDEQALVSAAAFCNVRFVHRTPTAVMLLEPGWTSPSSYKLLNVLEFDSDRKRMTVVVETPDGTIELLCKGADNVIFERLAADQATMPGGMSYEQASDQLTLYAKDGMRTLCLAYKIISRQEYEDWNARYTQAHASMEELVKRRQGRANAIDPLMNEIERDLVLLGVTAVQDKLQAGVPSTLRLLQETNIKVWTLTGDKMETAVNIGYASALLSHDMDVQQIGGDDYTSTAAALKELSQRGDQAAKCSHPSPFLASLSSRANGSRRTRRRDGKRKASIQTDTFLGSAKAAVSDFLFGAPTKQKRKQKRRRQRTRRASRMSSAFSQTLMYSSVATDAEHSDRLTSDEESLYDVGIEADDEAIHTPAYGSLAGNIHSSGSRQQTGSTQKLALVIDGQALEYALRPQLRTLFYRVTQQCASAVICCRVSPKQKADIVEFVCEFEPDSVTLAIGDGANDVAMIQAAHIGVGISGQEGAQAVNASDYALAQFRFLQRLLFVHGRWAYRRVAKLMSYMLYKNVTYVLTTFWFGCFCGFSGQPLILDVAAQSFNVLYTSVPLVLFAVFDQDVSSTSAAKFPYLYALGQKNVLLARRVFWPWIFNGVWHSIVIFFVSAWAFEGFGLGIRDFPVIATETGKSGGLVTLGFVVFTNLVIVVNLKLCLEAFLLTWQFLLTVTVSVLLWFAVGFFISLPNTGFPQATGEMEYLQELPTFWLVCLLVLSLSLLRDGLWKIFRRFSRPSMYHILQEREVMGLPNSPRRMLREHRRSVSNTAWSDEPATVVDYAKLFTRVENPEETLMRSSPLGERLIASPFSSSSSGGDTIDPNQLAGFQGREKKRNIRIRGSFHSIGSFDSFDAGVEPSFLEAPGSVATSTANAGVGARSSSFVGSYHGYAFSEDENVDSDVEAASSRTTRSDVDQTKSAFGTHVSIKKVLKSVRGRKNA
ncbi:P-type ATPase (P-ATPase) Superfamily [Phytophthora infestans T30-4]|uniref:Phospholipid-transporting ATPase n=1 Tax=Phytophthora infestans (strain T30-4) TaxID=403677 RepID=D0MQX5_PHYIT|nr:P-type ATPase (P-ATPase) Superfamily [Phytophthora infestans T30-4]EEY57894.1 P-type ATPase (P-ATPase) Superfamily [Phytophthora infestans T30-4]|eukprot:XP_002909080.1 P-type ATPase (P-ATPase) Superfamily [Phytophthora infestans T30-4]